MPRTAVAVVGFAILVRAALLDAQSPLPQPKVASLGVCRLASGRTISNCRLAYRAYGRLNEQRSNAILIATWLLGRSDDWAPLVGPEGYVDTTEFHVLVVDALGDGLSSSPSNSTASGRRAFADLTVGDMVESQYRLLTEKLGIRHLRAVVGFSMGGMQSIEWAVRYPSFVDRVVPIAGSARVGSFDRMMWTAMLNEIADSKLAGTGPDTVWSRLAHLEMLFVQTPVGINSRTPDSVEADVAANARGYRHGWKLDDYAAQLGAIRRYDVTRGSGDLRSAAARVQARMLAVYSWDDHMVTAGSVAQFAQLVHADTLSIGSPCGHIMLFCERARVAPAIRAFIAQ